jgi:hypothetical protein
MRDHTKTVVGYNTVLFVMLKCHCRCCLHTYLINRNRICRKCPVMIQTLHLGKCWKTRTVAIDVSNAFLLEEVIIFSCIYCKSGAKIYWKGEDGMLCTVFIHSTLKSYINYKVIVFQDYYLFLKCGFLL